MRKKITRKKGKKLIQSKQSKFDGRNFDSQLELYLYKRLKQEGIVFSFNEETIQLIPAFKYDNSVYEPKKVKEKGLVDKRSIRSMSYTPDFIGENMTWVVETKGRANESFPLRWKLFKYKMKELGISPILFLPRNKEECEEVISILLNNGQTPS